MNSISLKAPAKINLALRVGNRRADGGMRFGGTTVRAAWTTTDRDSSSVKRWPGNGSQYNG
ncbi:MAG: hypothetical protein IH914_05890 [candidate division Zixibacteria bacterium]|nr:hypothetical protein [candidate division Zixibacteria bacterium]